MYRWFTRWKYASFCSKLLNCLPSGSIIWHSPAMNEGSIVLYPCQHLMLSMSCILAILKYHNFLNALISHFQGGGWWHGLPSGTIKAEPNHRLKTCAWRYCIMTTLLQNLPIMNTAGIKALFLLIIGSIQKKPSDDHFQPRLTIRDHLYPLVWKM